MELERIWHEVIVT